MASMLQQTRERCLIIHVAVMMLQRVAGKVPSSTTSAASSDPLDLLEQEDEKTIAIKGLLMGVFTFPIIIVLCCCCIWFCLRNKPKSQARIPQADGQTRQRLAIIAQ